MELKDLSSNWKKLQLTLKQKGVASEAETTDEGREKQRGLKRKRAEKDPLHSQRAQHPQAKRGKLLAGMGILHSRRDTAASTQPPPTIRSIAQSAKSSFAADRVNEGRSQTYGATEYFPILI
jgi:hypothetical protein